MEVATLNQIVMDPAHTGKKFRVEFNEPTRIIVSPSRSRTVDQIECRFFVSTRQALCYTVSGRYRGWPVSYLEPARIVTVTPLDPPTEERKQHERVAKARYLAGLIHPNAWGRLRSDLLERPLQALPNSHLTPYRIIKMIPAEVRQALDRAFADKTSYHWARRSGYQDKRDISIECNVGSDGEFRAFYSSELRGCGNGAYFLLLNPTTAVYVEND